jgi:hypothetical protein
MRASRGEDCFSFFTRRLFALAIGMSHLRLLVLQEHCHRIGMRMHHRLFAYRVMDVQNAHRSVLKYDGVMLRVHLDRVLRACDRRAH